MSTADMCRSVWMDEYAAEFEQFVFAQKPAVELWKPVTDWSDEGRERVEGKHPELIRDVFQPKRVLDAGCGGAYLIRALRTLGVNANGFDIARQSVPGVAQADVADPSLIDGVRTSGKIADLVICREVLEHLTVLQIREAVRNLVRLSSRFVYVTTRYAANPVHLLSVDERDDLDPTHISMLSKPFLRTLFVLEGCKSRPDLEEKMDHMKKGRCLVMERA